MAMADSPNPETESEMEKSRGGGEIVDPNPTDGGFPSGAPFVCLARFAGDSAAGAFMGSIFGYGLLSHAFLLGCKCGCGTAMLHPIHFEAGAFCR